MYTSQWSTISLCPKSVETVFVRVSTLSGTRKGVVEEIFMYCELIWFVLGEFWQIIRKNCVGTKILTLRKVRLKCPTTLILINEMPQFIIDHSFLLKCCLVTIVFSSWAKNSRFILVTWVKPDWWPNNASMVFLSFCSMSSESFMRNKAPEAEL